MNANTLVGISSMTLTIDGAREIAQKAHARGAKVVVGGVHATLVPEDVATWSDSVVVGEAYHTWQRIVSDFEAGQLKDRYVDETWESLDHLAPITDRVIKLADEHRNYWTPSLEITRGCPRNCSFCTAIRVSGKIMRLRPIDHVVEEIERRKLKRFFLTDDNFGLNFRLHPEYMEQLFRRLARLPIDSWSAQSEMMVAQFPDLLKLAREAHLDKFFIGSNRSIPATGAIWAARAGEKSKSTGKRSRKSTPTASRWWACLSWALTMILPVFSKTRGILCARPSLIPSVRPC